MKKTILIICLIAMVTLRTNAEGSDNNSLELGGYLMTPKFFYNTCIQNAYGGYAGGIVDFGISASYPLNKNKDIVALLEVGYANYIFTNSDSSSIKFNHVRFNTINISPQISLKGFTAGFDFGFFIPPNLLNVFFPPQTDYYDYDVVYNQKLYLLNLKLGGIIPVYKTKTGTLNVLVKGTTSLSYLPIRQYNWFFSSYLDNIQVVSFSVGLNYMFNVKL